MRERVQPLSGNGSAFLGVAGSRDEAIALRMGSMKILEGVASRSISCKNEGDQQQTISASHLPSWRRVCQ